MDRYEFKVTGPKEKCVKLFLSSEEISCMESLLDRILTRFICLRRKEVSLKYADNNVWIELPADDLDSFIDMIKTAKDSARENLCNGKVPDTSEIQKLIHEYDEFRRRR